jgi:branched-chain amino acid transport system ATP-binding protein
MAQATKQKATGYHIGSIDTVISVEDVVREAEKLGDGVSPGEIARLAGNDPFVSIENLRAGYARWKFCIILICRWPGGSRYV